MADLSSFASPVISPLITESELQKVRPGIIQPTLANNIDFRYVTRLILIVSQPIKVVLMLLLLLLLFCQAQPTSTQLE